MRGPVLMRCALLAALLSPAACRGASTGRGGEARITDPAAPPPPVGEAPMEDAAGDRGEVSVSMLGSGAGRVERAIRRYAGDHAGRLPASLTGLLGESDPDGTPYLRDLPRDPWGRPIAYAVLSPRYGVYELRSFGPDGLPATGDDLVSKPEPVPLD